MPRGVLQTWACSVGSGLGSISRGAAEWPSHTQGSTDADSWVCCDIDVGTMIVETHTKYCFALLSSNQRCQYHMLIND